MAGSGINLSGVRLSIHDILVQICWASSASLRRSTEVLRERQCFQGKERMEWKREVLRGCYPVKVVYGLEGMGEELHPHWKGYWVNHRRMIISQPHFYVSLGWHTHKVTGLVWCWDLQFGPRVTSSRS